MRWDHTIFQKFFQDHYKIPGIYPGGSKFQEFSRNVRPRLCGHPLPVSYYRTAPRKGLPSEDLYREKVSPALTTMGFAAQLISHSPLATTHFTFRWGEEAKLYWEGIRLATCKCLQTSRVSSKPELTSQIFNDARGKLIIYNTTFFVCNDQ